MTAKLSRFKSKKAIVTYAVILLLVAIVVGALVYKDSHPKDTFPGTAGVSGVNYNPPTKDEQQAGDTQKDKVIAQQELDTNPTPAKTATLFISDASYYSDSNSVEIRAYVTNIIEDSGTCTATFTQGTQTVTETSKAFKDATTTQCGALNVPRAKFSTTGDWQLLLKYSSSTASGEQKTTVKL